MSEPSTAITNVVLTGFMGTGKSAVGRRLAAKLGLTHIDSDALIERRHGPIPRIFEELGEQVFEQLEHDIARELAHDRDAVISTGGRFMINPKNAALLTPRSRVFCLVADVDVIVDRVSRRPGSRPALSGHDPTERVTQLLAERQDAYAQFEQVRSDHGPIEAVVNDLLRRLATDDSPLGRRAQRILRP